MNKFIDLGCHVLDGLSGFLSNGMIDKSYSVYCFEANPNVYPEAVENSEKYKDKVASIQIYNRAISNSDEEVLFNVEKTNNKSNACNLLSVPPSRDVVYGATFSWTQVHVQGISAKTLMEMCAVSPDDRVKIKCDIEGGEFDFLWDLLNWESISCVKEMYIEWHERFWYPMHVPKIEEKKTLIHKLTEKGIAVHEWH